MTEREEGDAVAQMLVFRDIAADEVFSCVNGLMENIGELEAASPEMISWLLDCVCKMVAAAERYGLGGNIWQAWLALLLAQCENAYTLAQERREPLDGTLSQVSRYDCKLLYDYFNYDLGKLDKELDIQAFGRYQNFQPSEIGFSFDRAAGAALRGLLDDMRNAGSDDELHGALLRFYGGRGVGRYALHKAFRWDGRKKDILPVTHTEEISLGDIVGYEEQKKVLAENTAAFLENRPANNVLLYGESGTGKSSSIKALLNEYSRQGLRMIEVYKHQIEDLNTIVDIIKDRNYKFVIFMDDLSFEQFEVEYKFLKAFIEGGLEKRPDNILIYATSNRRHLMRESWNDRTDKGDDMRESETMQEKMSLVDRFGLMIRYLSPEQEEYLNIVKTLARSYGVAMAEEELINGAIRWELRHGGFSGRCARQYVEHLAGSRLGFGVRRKS